MDWYSLLKTLIGIPAPPGQEGQLRAFLMDEVGRLNLSSRVDARGNLLFGFSEDAFVRPSVVVMAHLDEIAMCVTAVNDDGQLSITNLGGLYPWKCGEGPVDILLGDSSVVPGILSFGSIHTDDARSTAVRARTNALTWDGARIFTGLNQTECNALGIRPGTRVVLGNARRTIHELGDYIAAPFLDDRADIVAMLLAAAALASDTETHSRVLFAATVSEEVGGHGAQYLLRQVNAPVAIALEIAPNVIDAPVEMTSAPSLWVKDSFCAMQASDIDIVEEVARDQNITLQYQSFSRGGSDASCAAASGLVARPFTLAFPAENSHGVEITHKDSIVQLSRLATALISRVVRE